MLRAGWRRWEAMAGARYELFDRQLTNLPLGGSSHEEFMRERRADVLPSTIVKYRTGEMSHLRAALTRTLLRPLMPAQVPVQWFDHSLSYYWIGDTTYRTGSAWNLDIRYEWVRGSYRLGAVTLFYKRLRELPELYLVPESYSALFTYRVRNRPEGEVLGLELEWREVFLGDVVSPTLWGYLNVTLSESGRRLGVSLLKDPYNGRLQGQAPYVVNAGLIGRPTGVWEVSTFFNYTGPQIWALGFDPNIYPHIVERGRVFWEWQVSRRIGRWELRLSVWDVLNQPYRRVQRVGNANRPFDRQRDAEALWQREEWRFYLTVRYRVF